MNISIDQGVFIKEAYFLILQGRNHHEWEELAVKAGERRWSGRDNLGYGKEKQIGTKSRLADKSGGFWCQWCDKFIQRAWKA